MVVVRGFIAYHRQQMVILAMTICLFAAQCADFSTTLARHDMWQAAENLGAKEIHLLTIKDGQTRERVLNDILGAQAPILNRNMLRRVA